LRSRNCFRRNRGCRLPFSCFTRPDLFSSVSRASTPIFIFCAPRLVFSDIEGFGSRFLLLRARTHFWRYCRCWVPFLSFVLPDTFSAVRRALGVVFMFYAPGLIFGATKGVWSHFHVLRARTHFWRYRGRRCFARTESFSAITRASGPIFMFRTPGFFFGGNDGVGSQFPILRSRTRF
jgi:hypothetical protein